MQREREKARSLHHPQVGIAVGGPDSERCSGVAVASGKERSTLPGKMWRVALPSTQENMRAVETKKEKRKKGKKREKKGRKEGRKEKMKTGNKSI